MEMKLEDLEKEFPTFLDLYIEAGKFEIDGIPRLFKNRNGEISDPIQVLNLSSYELLFNRYIFEREGVGLVNPERGYLTKYLTLNYFLDFIAKGKSDIKKLNDEYNQTKKFVDDELKKRLKGVFSKPDMVALTGPEKAFLIFYENWEEPKKNDNQSLWDDFRYWKYRSNRIQSDPKTNDRRKKLFDRMISKLSPEAKLKAEEEYRLLLQNIDKEEDEESSIKKKTKRN